MDEIKVTVYLSTYNQEEFLREALDSILMQKCNFRYELLIADDCSTDGTQAIALEYKEKYPDIITTYFTPVNVGGCKKLTNCIDMGLFRGEYLAYLEGDDYWLDENRLQILIDFLDANPEYSRVSHRRRVINENGEFVGYDISEDVCGKPFTVKELMDGKDYSDFGSVFRNYFKEAGDKYHPILLASRNVCDFQDLFITQDFGPVFVMDKVLGVYRSRRIAGASNYNSITPQVKRNLEKIKIVKAVEAFYEGRYDLTPRIRTEQRSLINQAVLQNSEEIMNSVREVTDSKTILKFMAEQMYLALRGRNKKAKRFIKRMLTKEEKSKLPFATIKYALIRAYKKLRNIPYYEERRGYINPKFGEKQ